MKLCECGCGGLAPIASKTNKQFGHVMGQPMRFIYGHQNRLQPTGKDSHRWNGGRFTDKAGRGFLRVIGHPLVYKNGYILEHRVIVEQIIGRYLKPGECVHHIDGDVSNNTKNNLVACENNNYHQFLHLRQRAYHASGDSHKRKCYICGVHDSVDNLYMSPTKNYVCHKACRKNLNHELYMRRKGNTDRNAISSKNK